MAEKEVVKGTTSLSVLVDLYDATSITGDGITGLVYNSAGLIAYYARAGSNPVAIALATQTVTGAFSSGGFVEVDATHMKGIYRLDIPDAALATGATGVTIIISGAANLVQRRYHIELTGIDLQDAVRGGMSAFPNVATGNAGAIPVTVAGASKIDLCDAPNATALAATATAIWTDHTAGDFTQVGSMGIAINTNLNSSVAGVRTQVDAIKAKTDNLPAGFPANFAALGISNGGHISNVDTLTTYSGDTPQTGDSFARIGANGASLTALGDARIANLDATISSRSTYAGGAVASVTGNVGGNVVGSVGSVAATVDGKTQVQALQIIAAMVAGKVTGVAATGPNTEIYVGLDGVTTRATITIDATGNRTAAAYA